VAWCWRVTWRSRSEACVILDINDLKGV
jgi:hypothetical protein